MSCTYSHTERVKALFAHDYRRKFELRQLFVERNTNALSNILLELCVVKPGVLRIDGFDLEEVITLITHIVSMLYKAVDLIFVSAFRVILVCLCIYLYFFF